MNDMTMPHTSLTVQWGNPFHKFGLCQPLNLYLLKNFPHNITHPSPINIAPVSNISKTEHIIICHTFKQNRT